MRLVNLFDNLCISPASTAVCLSVDKRYPLRKRKHNSQNRAERTRLLEGHVDHGEIEEQVSELMPNPKMVVLKVSLHCQGCVKKVRKHISKMEGVTSFAIDLENKKVTVIGSISPIGVLESICKVKNAEFWPNSM